MQHSTFMWKHRKTYLFSLQVYLKWTNCRTITNRKVDLSSQYKSLVASKTTVLTTYRSNFHLKMSENPNIFKLSDYDCIGFDLDNTLCKYKVQDSIKMEYDILTKFLVNEKNYSGKHLLKPIENDINFIKKGLMIDFENGNIIQISKDGTVIRAHHGTKILNDNEVIEYYGTEKKCSLATEFCSDILGAWNGPLSLKLRTLLDSFDMPASLAFARIIDTLDENNGRSQKYEVWPDVLEGLYDMYQREQFAANTGGYFPSLKADPTRFINECSVSLLSWLKMLKGHAKTFLLTGSNADFASLVASHSLGSDWSKYFDLVICYARKPGFFISSREFFTLEDFKEISPVAGKDLKLNEIYSQGNWNELLNFFATVTGKVNPKCLYIGDNLIQDIYIPSKYVNLDTVSVVDNLALECAPSSGKQPWLSYFGTGKDCLSIWSDIISTHSKICIPDVDILCQKPIDYPWPSFSPDNCMLGFHPHPPPNLF